MHKKCILRCINRELQCHCHLNSTYFYFCFVNNNSFPLVIWLCINGNIENSSSIAIRQGELLPQNHPCTHKFIGSFSFGMCWEIMWFCSIIVVHYYLYYLTPFFFNCSRLYVALSLLLTDVQPIGDLLSLLDLPLALAGRKLMLLLDSIDHIHCLLHA